VKCTLNVCGEPQLNQQILNFGVPRSEAERGWHPEQPKAYGLLFVFVTSNLTKSSDYVSTDRCRVRCLCLPHENRCFHM